LTFITLIHSTYIEDLKEPRGVQIIWN